MKKVLSSSRAGMRSMRARMTAQFALFVALLLMFGCMSEWTQEQEHSESRVQELLAQAKTRAQFELNDAKNDDDDASLFTVTREAQGEISAGGLALLVVNDKDDEVLWDSRERVPSWPDYGPDWRVATLSSGGQTLVLARDWKPTQQELNRTALGLWRTGLFVVFITAMGAWVVVGRTLLPIEKLAQQARTASVESLQVRLHAPSSDAEMHRLTDTLNDLLARLEHESQLRGRFYAAASHELRTPIQGLLGKLDVACSRPRTAAEYEAVIESLQGATERLAGLVENMLQLNALEMGQVHSPLETINLAFWIERSLEQQSAEIEARSLRVKTQLQDAVIEAPSFHVEILFRNLMENAVKYATSGTDLCVCLKATDDGADVCIKNAADVPADTDMHQWFEPFFRMDKARGSLTGGNGLGLAIVDTLAHTNGWIVALEADGGQVMTRVWLPKVPNNAEFQKPNSRICC